MLRLICALALTASLAACSTGFNYTGVEGPRYAGRHADSAAVITRRPDSLLVVSFNIKFAKEIDSALVVLQTTPEIQHPDILFLQEMDAPGVQRIATALRMSYVYFPAMLRKNTKREFGNAVLTPWPITSDSKIVLPHIARFHGGVRTATGATLQIGDLQLRVYSVHLGTIVNVSNGSRNDQMRAVLADAQQFPRVIFGGDLNSFGVGRIARDAGYAWPTEKGPKTVGVGRWDHIFVRGLQASERASGTVLNNHHASDHKPVWIRVATE